MLWNSSPTRNNRSPATRSISAHLQPVGVLKLVHHHLGEPLPVLGGQLGRALQQLDGAQLEIVEVDQRAAVLELLIAACELLQQHVQLRQVGDRGARRGPPARGRGGPAS